MTEPSQPAEPERLQPAAEDDPSKPAVPSEAGSDPTWTNPTWTNPTGTDPESEDDEPGDTA